MGRITKETMMPPRSFDLTALSIDDLSKLHEELRVVLAQKINEEKRKLERRLAALSTRQGAIGKNGEDNKALQRAKRRPYPPVVPKYRNPADPSETWAGRGKQPRWLVSQLRAGKKVEDFRIKSKTALRAAKRA